MGRRCIYSGPFPFAFTVNHHGLVACSRAVSIRRTGPLHLVAGAFEDVENVITLALRVQIPPLDENIVIRIGEGRELGFGLRHRELGYIIIARDFIDQALTTADIENRVETGAHGAYTDLGILIKTYAVSHLRSVVRFGA